MQFASMSLGIFDFLIEWLTNFLIWIIGFFIDLLMALFAELFYSIGAMLLNIVDFIQLMFRKLCGLDTYYVGQVPYEGMDPLLSMMTDRDVTQVLIALTMVAVVMVIIASIIKVIQSEFSTEGSKNSKGQIFGAALKSLMLFIVVPVTCIGGVILSNMMLKVIDRATSLSDGNATMGSNIMVSACANANKIRLKDYSAPIADLGINQSITENNQEQIASLVDEKFRNNSYGNYNKIDTMYYDTDLVDKYYVFKEMNFITLIGGALLAAYTMVMASFGMVMRLFKGAVLFMISPPMVALMPLDGGSAFKQWRTGFLKQILSAYGTIVSLNLLFIILPVVNNINLFAREDLGTGGGMSLAALNGFCHVLFTLTGLFMLKDISGLISNMIGAEDAAASGAGMAGKVVGAAAKIGTVAGGVGGLAMKGLGAAASKGASALAKGGHGKSAKVFGAIGGALGNTGNKMFQKGKGTLAAAINKGTGMMTGGALKTSFSEEMDYDKAVAAKKEKDDKRDERFENGEATIGDWARKGVGLAGKWTAKGAGWVAGTAVGTVGGVAAGAVTAAKGAGFSSGFGKVFKGAQDIGFATPEIIGAVADGGAKLRSQALAVPAQLQAATTVTGSMTSENTKLTGALRDAGTGVSAFDSIQAALQAGKRGEASEQIDAILTALQGIADKTEDQKDLMQKLTTLQQQVNSSSGTKASLKRIGDDMSTGLSTAMSTVETRSNITLSAIAANPIDATKGDIKSQLDALATKIHADLTAAGQTVDLEKLKREILAAQKAELEKLKGDKK